MTWYSAVTVKNVRVSAVMSAKSEIPLFCHFPGVYRVWEVWGVWEDGEEIWLPTLPPLPTLKSQLKQGLALNKRAIRQ
jgi:hypothetical protein